MSELQQFRSWLVNNFDKKGTPDYNTVRAAYDELRAQDEQAEESPIPEIQPKKRIDYSQFLKPEPEYNPPPPVDDRGAFSKGISRGIDNAGVMAGSALEGIGNVTGIAGLSQMGREQIRRNEAELAAQEPGTSWDQVEGVGTFMDYALGTLGETLPLTGGSILAGVAAAAAAPAGAATAIAGVAGSALSQMPFFYGGNRERQKEAIEAGLRIEMSEGAAFLTSLPQAALDATAERFQIRLLSKGLKYTPKKKPNMVPIEIGDKQTVIKLAEDGIFTRAAKGVAKGVIAEVPTEIGQSVLERIQAGMDALSDEAMDEYIEVGRAAGLVGGVLGGGAGAVDINSEKRKRAQLRADREQQRKTEIGQNIEKEIKAREDAGQKDIPPKQRAALIRKIDDAFNIKDDAEIAAVLKEHGIELEADQSGTIELADRIYTYENGKVVGRVEKAKRDRNRVKQEKAKVTRAATKVRKQEEAAQAAKDLAEKAEKEEKAKVKKEAKEAKKVEIQAARSTAIAAAIAANPEASTPDIANIIMKQIEAKELKGKKTLTNEEMNAIRTAKGEGRTASPTEGDSTLGKEPIVEPEVKPATHAEKVIKKYRTAYESATTPEEKLDSLLPLRTNAETAGDQETVEFAQQEIDALESEGYDINTISVGQKYNEGMEVLAEFVVDESLGVDEQIITKVRKPQINKDGKMIQAAEIVVSIGRTVYESRDVKAKVRKADKKKGTAATHSISLGNQDMGTITYDETAVVTVRDNSKKGGTKEVKGAWVAKGIDGEEIARGRSLKAASDATRAAINKQAAKKKEEPVVEPEAAEEVTPEPAPEKESIVERTVKKAAKKKKIITKKQVEAARDRAKANLGRTNSLGVAFHPQNVADMIVTGAYYIQEGAQTFTAFSEVMLEEFGDVIKPRLRWLYDKTLGEYPDLLDEAKDTGETFTLGETPGVPSDTSPNVEGVAVDDTNKPAENIVHRVLDTAVGMKGQVANPERGLKPLKQSGELEQKGAELDPNATLPETDTPAGRQDLFTVEDYEKLFTPEQVEGTSVKAKEMRRFTQVLIEAISTEAGRGAWDTDVQKVVTTSIVRDPSKWIKAYKAAQARAKKIADGAKVETVEEADSPAMQLEKELRNELQQLAGGAQTSMEKRSKAKRKEEGVEEVANVESTTDTDMSLAIDKAKQDKADNTFRYTSQGKGNPIIDLPNSKKIDDTHVQVTMKSGTKSIWEIRDNGDVWTTPELKKDGKKKQVRPVGTKGQMGVPVEETQDKDERLTGVHFDYGPRYEEEIKAGRVPPPNLSLSTVSFLDSFLTIADLQRIKVLFEKYAGKLPSEIRTDNEDTVAFNYFRGRERPEDSIFFLAYNKAKGVKAYADTEKDPSPHSINDLLAQTGGTFDTAFRRWIKQNLSPEATARLDELIEEQREVIATQKRLKKRQEAAHKKQKKKETDAQKRTKDKKNRVKVIPLNETPDEKQHREGVEQSKTLITPVTEAQVVEAQAELDAKLAAEKKQKRKDVVGRFLNTPLDEEVKITHELLLKLGIPRNSPIHRALVGKNFPAYHPSSIPGVIMEQVSKHPVGAAARKSVFAYNVEMNSIVQQHKLEMAEAAADVELKKKQRVINAHQLYLLAEAVEENATFLHPAVAGALRQGDLRGALAALAGTTNSTYIQKMASKLGNKLGDTKVVVEADLTNAEGLRLPSLFDPSTNTIHIDEATGLVSHALFHEVTHALASAELDNASGQVRNKLNTLFNDVKGQLGTAYGATNLQEFVAEAMGSLRFREELAHIFPKGERYTAWEKFKTTIVEFINRILGRNTLVQIDNLIEGILAPAPQYRNASQLSLSEEAAVNEHKFLDGMQNIAKKAGIPENYTKKSFDLLNNGSANTRAALMSLQDIQRIGDLAEEAGMGNIAKVLHKIADIGRGDMTKTDMVAAEGLQTLQSWQTTTKDRDGKGLMDRFVYNEDYGATIYQVDPTLSEEQAKEEYKNDPEKLNVWYLQRPDWNALGSMYSGTVSGIDAYLAANGVFRKQFEELQKIVETRIDSALGADDELAIEIKKDVFTRMFGEKQLRVYFPLRREGRYKISYMLKTDTDAGKLAAAISGGTYIMEMVDSRTERNNRVAELKGDPDVVHSSKPNEDIVVVDTKYDIDKYVNHAPPSNFVTKVLDKIEGSKDLNNAAKIEVKGALLKVFTDTLPEASFAQSLRKRKNTPGYIKDVEEGLRTKGFDIGRQAMRMKTSAAVMGLEDRLDAMKYEDLTNKDTTEVAFEELREEIRKRALFIRNPPNDWKAQRINQFAFVYTIGFNASSALVNLSQVPLFVFPYLGAKYNYDKTGKAIMDATRILAGSFQGHNVGLDHYFHVSTDGVFTLREEVSGTQRAELTEIVPLLEGMFERGLLNRAGFLLDSLGMEEAGRQRKGNKVVQWLDGVTSASAIMFNSAERFNRQATALSAYTLELDKLKAEYNQENGRDASGKQLAELQTKATEEAIYNVQEANGGAFLETAPRITQQGWPRVAMMYKAFGLRMYMTMIKSGMQAMSNAFPGTDTKSRALRKEAIKQLMGWHLTSILFAGVQGMPLYGVVKMLMDVLLDDDEEDWDTLVRNQIGEGPYRGLLEALTGWSVADRTQLSDLLIQENRYNQSPSPEEFFGFYLGGPALSSLRRFEHGRKDILAGHTRRAFESFLPPAFANAWKTLPVVGRLDPEGGYRTRRNDMIYGDVTTGNLIGQLVGFQPSDLARIREVSGVNKKADTARIKEGTALTKAYWLGLSMGDRELVMDTHEDILKYNKRNPEIAIDADRLQRSVKSHYQTTATMQHGTQFSPKFQKLGRTVTDWLSGD